VSTQVNIIVKRLVDLGNADIAVHSQRFFKTAKGEYGEGDRFLGIRVPVLRKMVREYRGLSLKEILELLSVPYHEGRLLALLILVAKYLACELEKEKKAIYKAYLDNITHINNWDLVDSSAYQIVGAYLYSRDKQPLYKLAHSRDLWARRISIIATYYFIKCASYSETLDIAEKLLLDREDLIHKAVGWMLREVGKRDVTILDGFLTMHYKAMPRTMLRYAIEKHPEADRLAYLHGSK